MSEAGLSWDRTADIAADPCTGDVEPPGKLAQVRGRWWKPDASGTASRSGRAIAASRSFPGACPADARVARLRRRGSWLHAGNRQFRTGCSTREGVRYGSWRGRLRRRLAARKRRQSAQWAGGGLLSLPPAPTTSAFACPACAPLPGRARSSASGDQSGTSASPHRHIATTAAAGDGSCPGCQAGRRYGHDAAGPVQGKHLDRDVRPRGLEQGGAGRDFWPDRATAISLAP